MAFETRPSGRGKPTPSGAISLARGTLVTKRDTFTPNETKDITIPSDVSFGMFKNAGTSQLKIQAGADNTQYFSIVGQQQTPTLSLSGGEIITIESSGGPGTLECIFWG